MAIDYGAVSDPKGIMQLRFKCPKCGSSMFGTSHAGDWDNAVGHCRGFLSDGESCGYDWQRATGDKDVFVRRDS